MSENWNNCKFGDIAELSKDGLLPSEGSNLPYIGLEHIEQQTLRLNSIGNSSDVSSQKFKFLDGDILYGKLRPYFRKVYNPKFSGICSTDIWVIKNKPNIDKDFLYYLIASEEFTNLANRGSTGTRMPRANWKQITKSEWNVPESIEEQSRIAEILSKFDEKIELNLQMNATLENIAQAIFKQWFVDFQVPDFDGELVDGLPKGWKKDKINQLASNIQYGFTESSSEEEVGPKFLRITDIQGGTVEWQNVPYCVIDDEKFEKYKIVDHDIFIARTGASTGENVYAINSPKAVFASYLIRVQFDNSALALYVGKFLRRTKYFAYIASILGGSAQPNANAQELTNIEITVPSNDILTKYFEIVNDFNERKVANEQENQSLTQLRDTLLPRLMSGKIRV
jgi:type I restriction enzyme S subunit